MTWLQPEEWSCYSITTEIFPSGSSTAYTKCRGKRILSQVRNGFGSLWQIIAASLVAPQIIFCIRACFLKQILSSSQSGRNQVWSDLVNRALSLATQVTWGNTKPISANKMRWLVHVTSQQSLFSNWGFRSSMRRCISTWQVGGTNWGDHLKSPQRIQVSFKFSEIFLLQSLRTSSTGPIC